jgi:serine/threonine protein kinase
VEQPVNNEPRILLVEPDQKVRSTLLRIVVKGFDGSSVQSTSGTLEEVLAEHSRLQSFDVLLVGCDFGTHGMAENPTLRALRAIAADPNNPAVILMTTKGSEYTAVQAIKAGAFDYIPKALLGREVVLGAVQRALLSRKGPVSRDGVAGVVRLFGYDMRRCLANRENVSVHVAFSAERGKEVVLKVLHRGRGSLSRDDDFDRLVSEFKLLYDIADRAVAEIYDFRVTSQYSYIAMEYFPLGHLGTQLTQALEPAFALKYTAEIAHALSIIHTAGVVHRDLKPANIMLRDDGTVALIDFGISHQIEDILNGGEGQPISGTPYYISPEQALGQATDERTDLYALGVILYQMLTGEKPFTGDTTDAILEQHHNAAVPRLPPQLKTYQVLLDKLLAKEAAQRLSNAREVTETIDRLTSPAPKAAEPPLPAVVVG